MEHIKRAYRNGLYTYKGLFGFLKPQVYLLVKVANPILQVIFFSMVAMHAYGSRNIAPYVVGNAFVLCTINAFFGVGTYFISERSAGTLKLIVASPCSKFKLFFTKSTFDVIDGIITVFIGLITGALLFNVFIPIKVLPYFLLCLIAAVFTSCSMGLFIGSIGLVTRDINLLLNLSSMTLMSLSGVNFPIERLPMVLQKVSSFLPLTNALKACRILVLSKAPDYSQAVSLLFKEFLVGIMYCIIAYITFIVMERMSKVKASLDIY